MLTRAGVWIVRQRIDCPTAYDTIRIFGKTDSQGLQPIAPRPTIIISEGKEGSSCFHDPGVPRSRRASVRLSEQRQVKPVTEGSNHFVWSGLAAIIHHDRFEAVLGIAQMRESLQAGRQLPWAIVRRDNNRENGRARVTLHVNHSIRSSRSHAVT